MMIRTLKQNLLRISLLLIGVTAIQGHNTIIRAESDATTLSTPLSSENSANEHHSWFDRIDSRWAGRIKTIGAVSWADDDTFFEPVGTGTFYDGSADLRLINETFLSDRVYFEAHNEIILAGGDSRRKRQELNALFRNFPEQPLFLGAPLNDDRRLLDLTHTLNSTDSYILFNRVDRLYLAFLPHWGSVKIGRQAVTWGNGLIFNPLDLLNPFPPTEIDRDYKVGDDIVNVQFSVPEIGNFQCLYVPRRNPETNNVQWDQSALAGKLHFATGTTEFDIMAAKNYEDGVVGIGSTGYLGGAAWRLDGTWTFLNDPSDESPDSYLSLVANMDYAWMWWSKNFYGFIEYFFNGLGENDYPEALLNPDITERLERGELFVLGKNYLSGTIQVELHPLVNVFFTAINNIKDPSGILQPRATWDITQNLQMTFGGNIFYGEKGSEFGGFIIPGTYIRSRSPDNVFMWFNYYF